MRTLAFGGILILVALSLVYFGLSKDGIQCTREAEKPNICNLFEGVGLVQNDNHTFEISSVGEVRWVPYTKPKSGPLGKTVLVFKGKGKQIEVADGERSSAETAYNEISSFFENATTHTLNAGAKRSSMFLWWGLATAALGLAIAGSVARKTRHVIVEKDNSTNRVTIRSKAVLFGSSSFSIQGPIVTVTVEQGTVEKSIFERSTERTEPGFRVTIGTDSSPMAAITQDFFKERWHMEAAANELVTFFSLDDRPSRDTEDAERNDDQSSLDSINELREPVVSSMPKTRFSTNPSFFKKNLVFYLPFILVAVVGGAFVYFTALEQGTLTVKCTYRCRMGASECLPGGSFTGTYDPGSYKIKVWNPKESGNWDTYQVSVKKGETTSFECLPKK